MTTDIHAASNATILRFLDKQAMRLDSIVAIAGPSPEGGFMTRTDSQIKYEYFEGSKRITTIYIRWQEEGYRVNAYGSYGMEEYDFRKVESFSDAVKIIKLIAIAKKAGK